MVATASLCVLGCRGFGTQNVSFTDTGLRLDERRLVESTVSTLYGMALLTKSASWLWIERKCEIEWEKCDHQHKFQFYLSVSFIPLSSPIHFEGFMHIWHTLHQILDSRMPSPVNSSRTNSIYTFLSMLYTKIRLLLWQSKTIWLSREPLAAQLFRPDQM